jgi:hypothetical protein
MTSQRKPQRNRGTESDREVRMSKSEGRRIGHQIKMLRFEMARAVSLASRTLRSRVRPYCSLLVRTSHFDICTYCLRLGGLPFHFVSLPAKGA